MNKELYNIEINKKVIDLKVDDKSTHGGVTLVFEEGPVLAFGSSHDQDCCESVYADYSVFTYVKDSLLNKTIETIIVKGVEGMGFLLCFVKDKWNEETKIFVPCYNYQNGYYSSDLELLINNGGVETKIDISNLVEDHID